MSELMVKYRESSSTINEGIALRVCIRPSSPHSLL